MAKNRRRKGPTKTHTDRGRATEPLRPVGIDDNGQEAERESAEARRKREDWERQHAQDMRERDEGRRALYTAFGIWTICPHKACTRAKACRGDDTEECRKERWREAVPDEVKAEIRKVLDFMRDGYSLDDACRLAHEDMEMRRAHFAELEARHGSLSGSGAERPARAAPPVEASPEAPQRGPRIRSL